MNKNDLIKIAELACGQKIAGDPSGVEGAVAGGAAGAAGGAAGAGLKVLYDKYAPGIKQTAQDAYSGMNATSKNVVNGALAGSGLAGAGAAKVLKGN